MLVTMLSIGYGDISPQSDTEIIIVMFCAIAGIVFFGILLGSIAEAITVHAYPPAILRPQQLSVQSSGPHMRASNHPAVFASTAQVANCAVPALFPPALMAEVAAACCARGRS